MIWHGLATYDLNGVERPGLVVDNKLYDLAQLALAGQPEQTIGMPDVDGLLDAWDAWVPRLSSLAEQAPGLAAQGRLTAIEGAAYALPYRPRRIFGVASNFYEHADEMGTQLAPRAESQPYVFMKAQSSVIATKATVLMPAETEKLDWEVELGVVIGQTCRHVSVEDALSVIAGYTVFNDISARDLNRRTDYPFKHDWFRGKSFDTFGPLGPWLVPAGCIANPQNLRMTLSVNGEPMQDGNTSQMIFSIAEQIAYLSRILTLQPGDLIATGTPDGVGMGRGVYLKPGDTMTAWVEGIGVIENPVALEAHSRYRLATLTTTGPAAGPRGDNMNTSADENRAPIRTRKLGRLVLMVRDLEISTRFYTEVMGLKVSDRIADQMVFLRAGEDHHDLALSRLPADAPDRDDLPRHTRPGLEHFSYYVESLDEMKRAVNVARAQGVEIERGIGQHGPGGNWFLVFRIRTATTSRSTPTWNRSPPTPTTSRRPGRANSNRSTGTAWRISWCSRPPRYWRPRKAGPRPARRTRPNRRERAMTFPFPPAPFPGLDDAQRAAMLALGPTWAQDIQENRRRVCDIYDAIHGALPADDLRVAPAQAYGDDPRQQLDLYLPIAHDQTARPIVAFVHGGAFLRGNKDATPHIYANVPRLFARAGCIGVNIEYRLAPRAPYPAGADDVAAAVGWLREHAAAWGGDPERIVLLGHSAGGSHVATFLTDPRYKGQAQGVTAAALISARLDADTLPGNPNAAGVVAYYGADPAQQRRHAPMAHAEAMTVPLMVAVAEYENPYLDLYALQYAARVARRADAAHRPGGATQSHLHRGAPGQRRSRIRHGLAGFRPGPRRPLPVLPSGAACPTDHPKEPYMSHPALHGVFAPWSVPSARTPPSTCPPLSLTANSSSRTAPAWRSPAQIARPARKPSERMALVDAVIDAGIAPERILVGTGCCAIDDAVTLTRHALELGCAGALVLPPFFFKNVPEAGVFAYYRQLIERVNNPTLRIVLYHIPAVSGVPLTLSLIERLVTAFPQHIVGVKDSSGIGTT